MRDHPCRYSAPHCVMLVPPQQNTPPAFQSEEEPAELSRGVAALVLPRRSQGVGSSRFGVFHGPTHKIRSIEVTASFIQGKLVILSHGLGAPIVGASEKPHSVNARPDPQPKHCRAINRSIRRSAAPFTPKVQDPFWAVATNAHRGPLRTNRHPPILIDPLQKLASAPRP